MAAGTKIDLKVVLLGKSFAGKTSLVERFMHDRFSGDTVPYQNTIGAAFGAKKIEIGSRSMVMGVWDTAGSERYEAMSRIYYRNARAAIVCYDLSDVSSFDRAKFWVNELKQNEEHCRLYLCGTKKDLIDAEPSRRKVDYHTATDYGDEIGAPVFETSSKTCANIKDLFKQIAIDYISTIPATPESPKAQQQKSSAIQLPNTVVQDKPRQSKCACFR